MSEPNKPKHYHSGFDYFTPDAGTVQSMNCKACNSSMYAERNVPILKYRVPGVGATSSETELRDKFTCTNSGKKWHDQVIALRRLQRDTPSNKISELLEEEITEIISAQLPTKDSWGF